MIALDRDGDVFVLRMRGGENRIAPAFLRELHAALDEVQASSGDAALVSTGEGKFYSNGLDLDAFRGLTPEQVRETLSDLHRLLARLLAFPMATVAAINGHAFAAGAMLALAHDFRVMRAGRGYVCLPEVDLGTGRALTPGLYALLDAKLTPSTAHEALITGRRYGGDEAAARGLVHEALPEAHVLPRAIDLARGVAGKDRSTMAALKRGLFASTLEALSQPLPDELLA